VKEAVGSAAENDYDLVVSDLGLPDGSGHEVIRRVKVRQPQTPAIALSGFGMDADVKKALGAGFCAHLTKPIGIEQLDAILDEIEQSPAGVATR
jgi:CheY-like chemotaxis protein